MRITRIATLLLCACLGIYSCSEKGTITPPVYGGQQTKPGTDTTSTDPGHGNDPTDTTTHPGGSPIVKTALADYSDMVLLYGYGHHRSPYAWGRDYTDAYVFYTDKSGRTDWLFDSFLMLEFMDPPTNGGAGVTFITGYLWDEDYIRKSATKADWDKLVNYYFVKDTAIDAVDQSVEKGKQLVGSAPPYKRRIVVGIPEPILTKDPTMEANRSPYLLTDADATYWGEIDGVQMNFAHNEDRIKAVKWYIDRVREEFGKQTWQNVELSGFYWVAEKSTYTSEIISSIGDYLKGMNFSFTWIPYYHADGYTRWKEFGFTHAFMQPNTAWLSDSEYAARGLTQMQTACNDVIRHNMGLEVEFDGNVLQSWGRGRDGRLRDYLNAFKDGGAWEKSRLVYYQGSWAVKWLRDSDNSLDQNLYHEFCDWVVTRPVREVISNNESE